MRSLAAQIKTGFDPDIEHGAFIVKTSSGALVPRRVVSGVSGSIEPLELLASLAPLYRPDDVVAFVHNHPTQGFRRVVPSSPDIDNDNDSVNRSPSDGDFGFIKAGLEDGLRSTTNLATWRAQFSHYIIGPDNNRIGENSDLREFDSETRLTGPVFSNGAFLFKDLYYVPSNIRIVTGGFLPTMGKFYSVSTKADANGAC